MPHPILTQLVAHAGQDRGKPTFVSHLFLPRFKHAVPCFLDTTQLVALVTGITVQCRQRPMNGFRSQLGRCRFQSQVQRAALHQVQPIPRRFATHLFRQATGIGRHFRQWLGLQFRSNRFPLDRQRMA